MQKKEEQQPRITGSNGACAREKSVRSARGGIGEDAGRGGRLLLQQLCGRIIACDGISNCGIQVSRRVEREELGGD